MNQKHESMVSFIANTDNDLSIKIKDHPKRIFAAYTLIAVVLEIILFAVASINNNEELYRIGGTLLLIVTFETIIFCCALSKSEDPYKGLLYFFGLYAIITEEVVGYLALIIVSVANLDIKKCALIILGCIGAAILFNIIRIGINIKKDYYLNRKHTSKKNNTEKYYTLLGFASVAVTGVALFIEPQKGAIVFLVCIVFLSAILSTHIVESGMRYSFAIKHNLGTEIMKKIWIDEQKEDAED